MNALFSSIRQRLLREQDRWILWLPVGFSAGILTYFHLPVEPSLAKSVSITLFSGLCLLFAARWEFRLASHMACAVFIVICGFTAAKIRTIIVSAPVLEREITAATVRGRVSHVETFPTGSRITLETVRITSLPAFRTPERIRLRVRGKQPTFWPGDWVSARARLSPPSPPASPGAFDFQRYAFFRQLGAVGFSLGPVRVDSTQQEAGGYSLVHEIQKLRLFITERILSGLPDKKGGIAAALMTGEKRAVDADVLSAIRDAGLAHLLSISGLHVGLMAGIIFIGLRLLFSLCPPIGLNYPTKKWAAGAAIACAFGYALIAGATLPTQRAFLMLAIALVAVIVDRRGISMRTLALAALVVLALQPESLLGPSFQMSFAAVMALIALYEWMMSRKRHDRAPVHYVPAWLRSCATYVYGVALTTLIAGLATAPFAAYHFNRIADYGLAANLVAVPVTALWIMPWSVIAFALMPFGLEPMALTPMGWGIDLVGKTAETVTSWPGAVTLVGVMPDWGLVCIVTGAVWLCLWRRKWRFFGLPGIALGVSSVFMVSSPDVLIDAKARLVGLKGAGKDYILSDLGSARFVRDVWLRRAGQDGAQTFASRQHRRAVACDTFGCVAKIKGKTVSIIRGEGGLIEDCWQADIIVSLIPVRGACPASVVVDRFDIWKAGAHAISINHDAISITSDLATRGIRPWVLRPRPSARRSTTKAETAH